MKRVLVGIYNHPEFYPPTLNAIDQLSEHYDIQVLGIPNLETRWKYPENVRLINCDQSTPLTGSTDGGALAFFKYCRHLYKAVSTSKADIILIYDQTALFAYWLVKMITKRPTVLWYHNHDVSASTNMSMFSLAWWSCQINDSIFKSIDLFSLPSEERLKFFPLKNLKGVSFTLPNYPSKRRSINYKNDLNGDSEIILIYQGTIAPGHGLEEILKVLNYKIDSRSLKLTLLGKSDPNYIDTLFNTAESLGVVDRVEYKGIVPYHALGKETVLGDIGIAFAPCDVNYKTAGKASNKIYEYGAAGLPILYTDNEHYVKHLHRFKWAIPTGLEVTSLLKSIESIINDYKSLSMQARLDFENELTYERVFEEVREFLT